MRDNFSFVYNNVSATLLNSTVDSTANSDARIINTIQSTLNYVAVLSNLLMIIVIFRNPELSRGCGWLIAHCLIAYTILCGVCFPITTIFRDRINARTYDPPAAHCSITITIQLSVRYAINIFEVVIAFNRVVAIYWPHQYRTVSSQRFINCVVLTVWLSAVFLALPGGLGFGMKYALAPLGSCVFITLNKLGVVNLVFAFYLPLALAGFAYFLIYAKLIIIQSRQKKVNRKATYSRRTATANMMFVAFLWNSIFYLLVPVAQAVAPKFFAQASNGRLLIGMLQVLGYVFNPIIFCAMNRDYRTALRNLLCCRQRDLFGASGTRSRSTKRGDSIKFAIRETSTALPRAT